MGINNLQLDFSKHFDLKLGNQEKHGFKIIILNYIQQSTEIGVYYYYFIYSVTFESRRH